MAQKRKMEITVVDENDRGLHSIFQTTANSLSRLYSLAINQQKLAFDAGQKHALEKLNEWIVLKLQVGKLVTLAEISAYLQNELNNSIPSSQLQQQWGSGSQQSDALRNEQIEMGLSSSASLDFEMENTSDNTHHY